MAIVPTQAPEATESVQQRFGRLAAHWRAETAHLSSASAIINHASFQKILGMGIEAAPFMLAELGQGPSLWVWALPTITGADPVPAEDRGKIARMTAAWLAWGKANGYAC